MTMRLIAAATALALAIAPAAMAGNGNGNVKAHKNSGQKAAVLTAAASHCPPGLAKKAVPCVPPGQAKKLYRTGDYITRDFSWINNPSRYGLNRNRSYVQAGDYVYWIDPNTHKVLNLIGAVADILG